MSDYFFEPPDEPTPVEPEPIEPEPVDLSTEPEIVEPATEPVRTIVFEDLTLGQALAYLVWRPMETARLFWRVLVRDPDSTPPDDVPLDDDDDSGDGTPPYGGTPWDEDDIFEPPAADEPPAVAPITAAARVGGIARLDWAWMAVLALAILFAIQGGRVLHAAALDLPGHVRGDTNGAGGWFLMSAALYLGAEMLRGRRWWARRLPFAAALRERVQRNDLALVWDAGLGFVILVLLGLAMLVGFWISVPLLALAAAVWLLIILAHTDSADDTLVSTPTAVYDTDDVFVVRSQIMPGDTHTQEAGAGAWFMAHVYRLALLPFALLMTAEAYNANVARDAFGQINDVVLTTGGFIAWMLSIALWIVILGVNVEGVPAALRRWRQGWRESLRGFRITWVGVTLAAITVLGAYFRLHNLASTPPEMTSDHIEKLLDALRVSDGYRGVFFPNNGGREGFQMYAVAAIADWFKVGFSFNALKLATAIEGIVTLPLLWWMAREVIGTETERDRQVGTWVGLALAGLVAISSWHEMLSRLGLRIVLTPLTAVLVIGFLARAMRHNRMRDYLALGLTLGAGIYFYQANRMLPVVVVVGIGLSILAEMRANARRSVVDLLGFGALALVPLALFWYLARVLEQSGYNNTSDLGGRLVSFLPVAAMLWFALVVLIVRGRRQQNTVLLYSTGVLAAAVVALAVAIPMYHYSEMRPDDFWNRTRGRMFGEEAFWRLDANGVQVVYEPTTREQIERFWDQRAVFEQNYKDALRMFHWEGDGAWISNAHSYPALDGITGGLAILGGLMWLVRMVRRRDPVLWLLPLAGLVLLLPSAMTLAYTIENPSFTRASGTIPVVFLFAALPLGLLGAALTRITWRRWPVGIGVGVLLVALVLGVAWGPNWDNFFTSYRLSYSYSWKPYTEIARPLRAFAQGEGSYGNAFMVAYPHWLDHRILGTMAGDIRWPNGLVEREDLFSKIEANQGTPYQYRAMLPMFVMYNLNDTETGEFLQRAFPGGTTELYEYLYPTEAGTLAGSFYIYRVWAGQIGSVD